METFEFLVTSTAMVTLQEHIKIQAQDLDDAIAKIEITMRKMLSNLNLNLKNLYGQASINNL